MAESVMINFRLKQSDVNRLDRAAAQRCLSRSDFIRESISAVVRQQIGGENVENVGGRGKARENLQIGKDSQCPKNPYCQFVKNSQGKICRTCGFRK